MWGPKIVNDLATFFGNTDKCRFTIPCKYESNKDKQLKDVIVRVRTLKNENIYYTWRIVINDIVMDQGSEVIKIPREVLEPLEENGISISPNRFDNLDVYFPIIIPHYACFHKEMQIEIDFLDKHDDYYAYAKYE